MNVCSFDKHPRLPVPRCTHLEPEKIQQGWHCNDICGPLHDAAYAARKAEILACPDCQAAQQAADARTQATCTIDPNQRYGEHISLTCRNHPNLHWHTKNIDYIGARSLFFTGWAEGLTECPCPISDLILTP